jgi:phage host-nuclease inhibitor protein Gam
MATKLKILKPVLKSRAEVERVVNETVSEQIAREKLVAERDAKIQVITEKYGPAIDQHGGIIESNMALLEQWADASSDEFGDARSVIVNGHRLGYRLGNPTVKPAGKLTVKAIVKAIADIGGDLARKFLRVKTDLDKDAVLATGRLLESPDDDTRATAAAELETIGCEIAQSETFYLDPAREGQADTTIASKVA